MHSLWKHSKRVSDVLEISWAYGPWGLSCGTRLICFWPFLIFWPFLKELELAWTKAWNALTKRVIWWQHAQWAPVCRSYCLVLTTCKFLFVMGRRSKGRKKNKRRNKKTNPKQQCLVFRLACILLCNRSDLLFYQNWKIHRPLFFWVEPLPIAATSAVAWEAAAAWEARIGQSEPFVIFFLSTPLPHLSWSFFGHPRPRIQPAP